MGCLGTGRLHIRAWNVVPRGSKHEEKLGLALCCLSCLRVAYPMTPPPDSCQGDQGKRVAEQAFAHWIFLCCCEIIESLNLNDTHKV